MSVYNSSLYLKQAIDSILNQTYSNFEFIIINDGSTDDSLSIIKTYSDKRIKLLENDGNKGLIYSLNKGIAEASGEFIARMDADDVCVSTRFEKQVHYMNAHVDIGVLSSDYYSFNETSKRYMRSIDGDSRIRTFLLFTATVCHPALMIRKSVLEINGLNYSVSAKHVEDFDLWTRLALCTKFATIKEALLNYRDHASQVSHVYSDLQKINSNTVRHNYLSALNFVYTPTELNIHNLISCNKKITSKQDLKAIENWLTKLIEQNQTMRKFESDGFNSAIAKVWIDCCGNTNLGLHSYFKYLFSSLKKYQLSSSFLELKLFAKCLIRLLR